MHRVRRGELGGFFQGSGAVDKHPIAEPVLPRLVGERTRRAEHTIRAEADPAAGLAVRYARGLLELMRGRDGDALTALRAAERLAGLLAAPDLLVPRARALLLLALVCLGEIRRAEEALAGLEELERERGEVRIATAELRLAQGDPHAATAVLGPVLDGSVRVDPARAFLTLAFTMEASARDALGDPGAVGRALERALDLAEPDAALSAFLLHPVSRPPGAPCPAPHRTCRPDRRDPEPARRAHARAAVAWRRACSSGLFASPNWCWKSATPGQRHCVRRRRSPRHPLAARVLVSGRRAARAVLRELGVPGTRSAVSA